MILHRIDRKLRNVFFFNTIYGLLYPSVLGAIFVYIIERLIDGKLFDKDCFSLLSSFFLIWYFILDFYIGFYNFKGDEESYDFRHMLCDAIIIFFLFLSYYGVWLSNSEYLLYVSIFVICLALILVDVFDAPRGDLHSYILLLAMIGLLSLAMFFISIIFFHTLLYTIIKYIFIIVLGIGVLYYTSCILSIDSVKKM